MFFVSSGFVSSGFVNSRAKVLKYSSKVSAVYFQIAVFSSR